MSGQNHTGLKRQHKVRRFKLHRGKGKKAR